MYFYIEILVNGNIEGCKNTDGEISIYFLLFLFYSFFDDFFFFNVGDLVML